MAKSRAIKPKRQPPPPEAVNAVTKWILTGATAYDVREAAAKAYPGLDPEGLILEAMAGLERAADFSPAVVRGWCFEAARDLYRQMKEIGDFAGAMRAVKLIYDMAGDAPEEPRDEGG